MIKALKMISEGQWTIRRAASFAGMTYYEILDKMAEKGIDSGPDLKDLGRSINLSRESKTPKGSEQGSLQKLKRFVRGKYDRFD
jgi:hypothetical protein